MISAIRTDHMDEEVLIRAASYGDLDAFNQLVLAYQDLVYHPFRKLNCFRGGSFRIWLIRIITNACIDELRHRKRHPKQPLDPKNEDGEEIESLSWLEDAGASVEKAMEKAELRMIVEQSIQSHFKQLNCKEVTYDARCSS